MNSIFAPHARGLWFTPHPGQSELTPRIYHAQATLSTYNGAIYPGLKPVSKVNQSPKVFKV